jgi:hypothetical protein
MADPPDISGLSVADAKRCHRPAKRIRYVLSRILINKHNKADATDSDIRDYDIDATIVAHVGSSNQRFLFHGIKLCGRSKWLAAFASTH